LPSAARYLAVDVGASGGRAFVGEFDGLRLRTAPLGRFPNRPVRLPDGLRWDALGLYAGVLEALGKAAADGPLDSLGVDTWGVDFGLLDAGGGLIGNPRHHRDPRNSGTVATLLAEVPAEEVYATTGTQFLPINTLCQLLALRGAPELEAAATLLMVPDLLTYWLTGEPAAEATNAGTTQMLDARSGAWATALVARLGLRPEILPPLVEPGTPAGGIRRDVAAELGLERGVAVTRVASHDTASAVVALPAREGDFAYISSGTWSLVGIERDEPLLGAAAMAENLTNERGFAGTTRVLKNVMGLWLLQQLEAELGVGQEELVAEAEAAPPGSLFDPDLPELLAPGPMAARIALAIERVGGTAPASRGELARAVLESLACKYRFALEQIEAVSGTRPARIHVVGGGCRNRLLCRLTADVCRRPVLAGPAEATAIGNLMVQAHAAGEVGSLADIRAVVRRSVEVERHEPGHGRDDLYGRFLEVLAASTPDAAGLVGEGVAR
jgi:rhamnulokinase